MLKRFTPKEAIVELQNRGLTMYQIGKALGYNSTGSIYRWINVDTFKPHIKAGFALYKKFNILLDCYKSVDDLARKYFKDYQ